LFRSGFHRRHRGRSSDHRSRGAQVRSRRDAGAGLRRQLYRLPFRRDLRGGSAGHDGRHTDGTVHGQRPGSGFAAHCGRARMNGTNPADDGRGRLFVWLQYAIPQHRLSRLVFAAARVRIPWFKNLLTRAFLKLFSVDMAEAIEADPYRYPSFNEFFTRALRPDARPIAAGAAAIASPADGMVSECGAIERDQLLQAKNRRYALKDLLAQQDWAERFEGGSFATIYLAPFNYHRVHMPARGRLLDTVYVPGRLFSVNMATAKSVPRLFARNERVLTLFEGEFGQFAVILIGALNV